MGLMGFINLAHGVFAMAGGYLLLDRDDARFGAALPAGARRSPSSPSPLLQRRARAPALFAARTRGRAGAGAVHHRPDLRRRWRWRASSTATLAAPMFLPEYLQGQLHLLGRDFPTYRVFLIVFSAVMIVVAVVRRRAHALGRDGARRGRQPRAWRSRWASTPGACSRSPSRSAAASPASAARSAPTSCAVQPSLPVRAPGLLPDRGRGRRPRQPARPVRRRAADRHRRHRVQVLDAASSARSSSTPRPSRILLWRPTGLFGRARMSAL